MTLLNCAHCGGEARLQQFDSFTKGMYVICNSCGLSTDNYDTPEEAAEAWNKRVVPKLEWQPACNNDICLTMGLVVVATAASSMLNNKEHFWLNKIDGSNGRAETLGQAKTECEASVRKSLKELMG